MRVLLVFTPIALLAAIVAVRSLSGRPLSRRALDIAIALLLLAYLTVTAGLGLFWVSRMDLPVFDWHYLFGYALLVVAAAHVSLQLRGLARFFRRRTRVDRGREGEASSAPRERSSSRAAIVIGGLALTLALIGLVARERRPEPLPALAARSPGAGSSEADRDGAKIVDRLHAESSYSRTGLLRSFVVAPPRPAATKAYPGRPRRKLPVATGTANVGLGAALDALRAPGKLPPRGPIDLRDVSALLFHGNGATASGPGFTLRAAASSGALYPTDVYVLSRATSGLDPGAYYHDGPAHELVRTGGEEPLGHVLAALPDTPGLHEAALVVVLGTTFDRTAWKYTTRTYRYLALDAGHVALNLVAAGGALGLDCTPLPVFDDARLGAALGLPPADEAALLVIACASVPTPPHPPTTPRHEATPWPDGSDGMELTRLSSRVTGWTLLPGFTWLAAPPAPRPPGSLSLPSPALADRDLFEVIRARRSYRELAREPVSKEAFSGILADASSVLGLLRGAPLVELFVAVRAVIGVEPGTYRYDADGGRLSGALVSGAPAIEGAGLDQALLGRAAFVLAWALVDERAGRTEGARDYRHASLEAGLAGEAAYLSAVARGLGICGVGAFYDEPVGALFASDDGHRPRVLYLQGVGAR